MYILDYKNSKFLDEITIDLRFYWIFASMEDIRWKYNPMVDLSKFTSNKKKSDVVVQVCYQILSRI